MVMYELPVGKGRHWLNRGGIMSLLFGGYQIVWEQHFETGNPLSFSFANSPYNYYPTFVGPRRPNVVGNPNLRDGWRDLGGDRFNTQNQNALIDINAFAYPAAFTPGNAGRNIVTGMGLRLTNVSAQKYIPIKERLKLLVRWDMQNVFHNFTFYGPSTTVDFQNPKTFAKLSSFPSYSLFGGTPQIGMKIELSW